VFIANPAPGTRPGDSPTLDLAGKFLLPIALVNLPVTAGWKRPFLPSSR